MTTSHLSVAWIHIAFLSTIALMPFSPRLLAEFMTYRVALLIYWGNILLPGWSCMPARGTRAGRA